MRKFKGYVSIGLARCKFEFEMEDYATEQGIEDAAREEAMQIVDWWYEEVE